MPATRSILAILSLVLASTVPARAFDLPKADSSTVRVVVGAVKGAEATLQAVKCCAIGSGFVIADEYVATNHHVIDSSNFAEALKQAPEARVIYIVRVAGSKKNHFAQLVWSSVEFDIAVLRVTKLDKPPLPLAVHSMLDYPRRGQRVYAIGYPGISDNLLDSDEAKTTSTVTEGIVGKVAPASMGGASRPVIQHDAAINQGNSGGPLFDRCGTVIGINTFAARTVLEFKKDKEGNITAEGMTPAGMSVSPHIGNLIASVKTVPALAAIRLTTTTQACSDEGGVPPAVYGLIGAIGLLTMATAALALTRRRQVVRVVESYSAWKHRRGVVTGTPRTGAVRAAMPPLDRRQPAARAGGDWSLTAVGAEGKSVRVSISEAEFKRAMISTEKGIVLGRSSQLSDKVIPGNNAGISRRHCKLALNADGTLSCEDLKSAYGTKLNDAPLAPFQPATVAAGDRLTLGETMMTIERAD